MTKPNRRSLLGVSCAILGLSATATNFGCSPGPSNAEQNPVPSDKPTAQALPPEPDLKPGDTMQVHYLEIVTPDVESLCTLYSKSHGVTFSAADARLGGARTVRLASGTTLGIRAPMHAQERPVTRPYFLVDDIQAAVDLASQAGAMVIVPPMDIPGHGKCAIFMHGGIESALWQVENSPSN